MRSKDLTPELRSTIRNWGLRQRITGCHPKGILAQSVIEAYFTNHPDERPTGPLEAPHDDNVIDGGGDEPPVFGDPVPDDDDTILAQITLPASVRDWEDDLTQQVANAIDRAFTAGRAYERGLLTQVLAPYLSEEATA